MSMNISSHAPSLSDRSRVTGAQQPQQNNPVTAPSSRHRAEQSSERQSQQHSSQLAEEESDDEDEEDDGYRFSLDMLKQELASGRPVTCKLQGLVRGEPPEGYLFLNPEDVEELEKDFPLPIWVDEFAPRVPPKSI